MRFLVDSLPYYYCHCPFMDDCIDNKTVDCPRSWSKEFVCSEENPHYCCKLRELEANNEQDLHW